MKTYKTISNVTRRKGLAVLGAILLPGLAHGVDYGSLRTIPASAMAQGEQIVLSWPANADIESYLVTRRDSAGAIKRFDGGATGMVDADVERGEVYEYSITGTNTAVGQSAMGVIATGIEAPLMDDRGRMILVVDDTVAPALEAELERLRRDLIGDGWEVARIDVSPQAGAPEVKAAIAAAQAQEPDRTRSVFLIGKIAVPYSGSIYPDGHPDHRGAWPADGYYGDLDGNWTDSSADVTASRPENTNVPGDGKFDQSSFPSEVELEVGRLDLSRLPAFAGSDEIALLRRYLDKNHAFRQAMWTLERRALVDDHFSHLSEGIARGSRGSFASFFGAGAVQDGDWKTELPGNGYLCAYGSGAGNYGSISGVANTADFAAGNFKVAFAFFCGSYFGDWDNENNVMRAALASGDYTLAAAWTGRPQWKTHGMGMGESIGSAARATQNNKNDMNFYSATNRNRVHINLLGDPSLRLHPVAPPQSASAGPTAMLRADRLVAVGGAGARLPPLPRCGVGRPIRPPDRRAGGRARLHRCGCPRRRVRLYGARREAGAGQRQLLQRQPRCVCGVWRRRILAGAERRQRGGRRAADHRGRGGDGQHRDQARGRRPIAAADRGARPIGFGDQRAGL
ncbi:MAG: hypothetical protein R3F11_22115 [Verrucomicrobiales bacterium]